VEALELVARLRPEVALVDVRMPRMDGVELVRRLAAEHPSVAALVLTTFEDDEYVSGGLRAGAKGYLLKDTPSEELAAAILKVRRGETVLGGTVAARVVSELMRAPAPRTGASPHPGDVQPRRNTRRQSAMTTTERIPVDRGTEQLIAEREGPSSS
jgi:DNA-binding NarL/FixJ family response regulator